MRASSTWHERSQRVGWDIFYTPLGGRLRSEKNLTVGDLSDESIKRLRSQSMIAISPAKVETIDPNVIFFCSVARKILQRGELPPVPTEIERVSLELFRPLESLTKDEISAATIGIRKSIVLDADTKFESAYEKSFWEFANSNYPDISAYLVSQAPMHCLVPTSKQEHWADFLLFGPWNADAPKVIEIDGCQHENEKSQDDQRDNLLRKLKIETSRIKGDKWQVAAEMGFKSNSQMLPQSPFNIEKARSFFGPAIPTRLGMGLIELLVRGHFPARADLEIALEDDLGLANKLLIPTLNFLHHIESLWGIAVLPRSITFDNSTYVITAKGYVADKSKAAKTIKIALSLQQYVTPQAELKTAKYPQCVIRGAFLPINLTFLPLLAANTRKLINPGEQEIFHLTQLMNGLFGHESFRENQSEAILTTLSGEDSLVLLPTGSGKSLIYQLIGLLQPGTTLVVDPLTALIKDQIRRLNEEGIDRTQGMHAAALNTSARKVEAFADIAEGQALFIFLSPERLHNKEFRSAMHAFAANHMVNSAVLDEAHCISEWGHDFRTAYLNVARNLRRICSNDAQGAPTLLALTGTASPAVLRDVIREIKDMSKDIKVIKPSTYDRKNLNYLIDIGDLGQSKERLSTLLLETIPKYFEISVQELVERKGRETNSGIVFVATRNLTVKTQSEITETLRKNGESSAPHEKEKIVEIFAGGAPDNYGKDWETYKTRAAESFIRNEVPILASTKAFGMGIDKPNIRWTIHRGFPSSLESFAQESGRAGRDGKKSLCVILASPAKVDEAKSTLNLSLSSEERFTAYLGLNKRDKDDLFTQLYFHHSSFSGTKTEIVEAIELLKKISPSASEVKVPWASEADQTAKERAIHRLLLLGLVDDYTKQVNDREFTLSVNKFTEISLDTYFLDFMRRLEPGAYENYVFAVATAPKDLFKRCEHHLAILIESVYRTIEPARIRALIEIQQICSTPMTSEEIRLRILAYLSGGPLATALEEIAETSNLVVSQAIANLNSIPSVEAEEWIGASARQLETYPDNPMLLAARSVGENGRLNPDITLLRDTLEATFASMPKYNIDQDSAAEVLMWLDEKLQGQIERPIDEDFNALSDAWEKSDFDLEPLLIWEQEVFKRSLKSDRWHNQLMRIGARRLARRTEDLDDLLIMLKG